MVIDFAVHNIVLTCSLISEEERRMQLEFLAAGSK
jgi:hypothetical protein